MGRDIIKIIAFIAGGALVIGLVTHAAGTAQVINSVTGFFGTGLSAELGQLPAPAGNKRAGR